VIFFNERRLARSLERRLPESICTGFMAKG
jgi:hypothetical protein